MQIWRAAGRPRVLGGRPMSIFAELARRTDREANSPTQGGTKPCESLSLGKATEENEAGVMPSEEALTNMMEFNEELVKAGVMLAGDGVHPSAKGVRVAFSGSERKVIDG